MTKDKDPPRLFDPAAGRVDTLDDRKFHDRSDPSGAPSQFFVSNGRALKEWRALDDAERSLFQLSATRDVAARIDELTTETRRARWADQEAERERREATNDVSVVEAAPSIYARFRAWCALAAAKVCAGFSKQKPSLPDPWADVRARQALRRQKQHAAAAWIDQGVFEKRTIDTGDTERALDRLFHGRRARYQDDTEDDEDGGIFRS